MILYMKKYYIIVDLAEGDEFFVIFMSESVQQCTSSVGSILAEGWIKEFVRGLFKKIYLIQLEILLGSSGVDILYGCHLFEMVYVYICKIRVDVQPLIDIQSSNSCPISTSRTSVSQIYILFQILKSASNSQIYVLFQILKLASNSQIYGSFSLCQIDVQGRHWPMS